MPLSEQFETIQNEARFKAIAKESQNHLQTVTLSEKTPSDILPENYPSLQDSENQDNQNQQQ